MFKQLVKLNLINMGRLSVPSYAQQDSSFDAANHKTRYKKNQEVSNWMKEINLAVVAESLGQNILEEKNCF